jgi:hypothetical protein
LELALDGVSMIQACFFEELLEVVLKQSCLALALARGLCSVISAGATPSLIDATASIECGLLVMLFAPLLAGLGAFLGTLESDAG